MQRYERLWGRLLTLLGTLGEVDAASPGRTRLRVERHEVTIVMTEREWEDLVGTSYGSFTPAAAEMLAAIQGAQREAMPYVVYDMYELHVGATPEKPVQAEMEADRVRVEEYLRQHPGTRGEWRAYSPPPQEPS